MGRKYYPEEEDDEEESSDSIEPVHTRFGMMAVLIILFGTLCAAGGYLASRYFAQSDDDELDERVNRIEKGALVQSSRASAEGRTSPAEMKSKNRLREIMTAMQAHNGQYGTFPPAPGVPYNTSGKPPLSWRVYLLPFLGQTALYQQFHLDEPWDSQHNRTLLDKMPEQYLSRGLVRKSNRTGFVLFQLPEMYSIEGSGPDMRQFRDGPANTLLVVEVSSALAEPWTRPDDIPFNAERPLEALGDLPKNGFWGGFADGSVRRIRPDINPDVFRGILTLSGGEVIQLEQEVELR